MIIFIISMLTISSILAYLVYSLSKKNNILEIITDQQSEWIDDFGDEIKQVYNRLKAVDNSNIFEKDDDVGFAFSEILRITREFDEEINNYENTIREKVGENNNVQFKSQTEEDSDTKRIDSKLKRIERIITKRK